VLEVIFHFQRLAQKYRAICYCHAAASDLVELTMPLSPHDVEKQLYKFTAV
jgi:hypothetical protein